MCCVRMMLNADNCWANDRAGYLTKYRVIIFLRRVAIPSSNIEEGWKKWFAESLGKEGRCQVNQAAQFGHR